MSCAVCRRRSSKLQYQVCIDCNQRLCVECAAQCTSSQFVGFVGPSGRCRPCQYTSDKALQQAQQIARDCQHVEVQCTKCTNQHRSLCIVADYPDLYRTHCPQVDASLVFFGVTMYKCHDCKVYLCKKPDCAVERMFIPCGRRTNNPNLHFVKNKYNCDPHVCVHFCEQCEQKHTTISTDIGTSPYQLCTQLGCNTTWCQKCEIPQIRQCGACAQLYCLSHLDNTTGFCTSCACPCRQCGKMTLKTKMANCTRTPRDYYCKQCQPDGIRVANFCANIDCYRNVSCKFCPPSYPFPNFARFLVPLCIECQTVLLDKLVPFAKSWYSQEFQRLVTEWLPVQMDLTVINEILDYSNVFHRQTHLRDLMSAFTVKKVHYLPQVVASQAEKRRRLVTNPETVRTQNNNKTPPVLLSLFENTGSNIQVHE